MDTRRLKLEKGQGTIYHELGHFLGYIFSSFDEEADLGAVQALFLGFEKNCVLQNDIRYHVKGNFQEDRKYIHENTKNVKRTVAWISEVLLGCTVQCVFEDKEFSSCFGLEDTKLGKFDCGNLSIVRSISKYRWDREFIDSLQNDLWLFIEKFDLIKMLMPIVQKLKEMISTTESYQIEITGKKIANLEEDISNRLPEGLMEEYKKLIINYSRLLLTKS